MAAPAPPLVHLKVQVSGVLSIIAQELWEVLRDYAQAQTWLGTYRGVRTFTTLLVIALTTSFDWTHEWHLQWF